jgi:hypothetical protein
MSMHSSHADVRAGHAHRASRRRCHSLHRGCWLLACLFRPWPGQNMDSTHMLAPPLGTHALCPLHARTTHTCCTPAANQHSEPACQTGLHGHGACAAWRRVACPVRPQHAGAATLMQAAGAAAGRALACTHMLGACGAIGCMQGCDAPARRPHACRVEAGQGDIVRCDNHLCSQHEHIAGTLAHARCWPIPGGGQHAPRRAAWHAAYHECLLLPWLQGRSAPGLWLPPHTPLLRTCYMVKQLQPQQRAPNTA